MKIGIALSGGGALGAAHAGVLHALEEADIVPHHVTGVSAGAIIGALYCGGNSPKEILEIFKINSLFELFSFQGINVGLVDTDYFQKTIKEHVTHNSFSEMKTRLSIGATNLNSGEFEIFEEGDVSKIAAASSAVPLLIKPVKIGKDLYVDGGLINNLLVEPLTESCDFVIGVNANHHQRLDEIQGIKEIGRRCFEIIAWSSVRRNSEKCDYMMMVKETLNYALFDFKHSEQLFEIGSNEMKESMDELLQVLDN